MTVSDFRFSNGQWRILNALTATMLPDTDVPSGLADDVVGRIEYLLRVSARETKFAFKCGLYIVEYMSPIFCLSWGRFSRLSRPDALRRFDALLHHRLGLMVLLAKLMKSLIQIALYSDQRVERQFGNQRRAWRENRFNYRSDLLEISEPRQRPATPEALIRPGDIDPETYLDWDEPEEPPS